MRTATCAFSTPPTCRFPKRCSKSTQKKLKRRAQREGVAFGPELAVQSVYEISEPIAKLLSDKWVE